MSPRTDAASRTAPQQPSAHARTPRLATRDAGFSMVEVLVAIAIIGLLVMASLPHIITSLRSNDVAARNTQAKTLAQAELELIRNLPWHISPDAGDYIDVFDRYYRNRTAPITAPSCKDANGRFKALVLANRGYVPAGSARCDWEPTGALYRQIRTEAQDPDLEGFVVVTDTQFVNNDTPTSPVAPPTGYNTQDEDNDTPAATQVRVTVTVLPTDAGVSTPVRTQTQVAKTSQPVERIAATLDLTPVKLGTTSPLGYPVTAHAGRVEASAELALASTINAVLSSVGGFRAADPTPDSGAGANLVVNAPPAVSSALFTRGNGDLNGTCNLVCWGGSSVNALTATAVNGLPNLGSLTAPISTALRQASAEGYAIQFSPGYGARYRDELRLDGALVRARGADTTVPSGISTSCGVNTVSTGVRVNGGGWIRTTPHEEGLVVDVCGVGTVAPLSVMPTDFAKGGVVRVRMDRLSARCQVSGPSHTPTVAYDYSATVERWTPVGYVTVATITPGDTVDKLAAVDLNNTQVGPFGPLSQWISSWSSLTRDRVSTSTSADGARVEIPGVVNISSRPTRYRVDSSGNLIYVSGERVVDPISSVSVSVGSLTCSAKDAR